MKISLSHLPENKQEELKTVTETIRFKVPAEMIILFGSYARGEWVEDYQDKYEYVSDFDILVITEDRLSAKRDKKWRELDKELSGNEDVTRTTIIQHSIGFINDKIERNSYFFIDILKEGIILFDSGNLRLAAPKQLQPEARANKAKAQFDKWFENANGFLKTFHFNFQENDLTIAAFQLHQATERYYSAILLVFTDYKPKLHDIEELGNQVAKLHSAFATIFPKTTSEEARLFDLLKKAYIDARYEMHYHVEKHELEYLGERVKLLKYLTERLCIERIAQFTGD
ncbi:HEPN domain-containing protein/predicted nucleotidyltransferase [Dyadobacter sp. BE34]|uniref:HEPN domain-containing protein/predicted nucleotidyltransferase n=1 Tax=Dyadobacter fermentans TaxID=94254 RepID=A0ABU1QPU5_9BACT|nr:MULTISPECIES: HEPN domain-containing protein [Dyadobacter]MDR6803172.1 HEPN domain-containing protein/predicted nucleotidyltransferase [Dyadobacter fermentans]MDR7040913.1 HEPN domain-containing protein/predicted nucleotidyltransferase [Dyadobacter sp. BE242]MDR7195316.1 HEPN domain-containing protein/predicted nucleotidyltransferase [Dyadobacter sp. BE34]MDR7214138.1 HEPN domain-containing protein/predicted nucleotidyltransferase [Dyadobacter sp. BE31]MDR7260723.1 HEPN domain-containing pr